MLRNLKALGFALVAVFAMGALTASAASATDFFTTANGESAYLTGTSHDNLLNITGAGSSFECTTSQFTGTAVNGSSEVTVLASYSGILKETPHTNPKCSASLGTMTVDMNDCHYRLTGNTTGSDSGTDATFWIQCPGAPITMTFPLGVKLTIPSQTPTSGGVTYTNVPNHSGSNSAVTVKATVTGITYNCDGAFCGAAGIPAHGNDADYNGTVTVTGYTDTSTNSTTNLTGITEGALTGVSVS